MPHSETLLNRRIKLRAGNQPYTILYRQAASGPERRENTPLQYAHSNAVDESIRRKHQCTLRSRRGAPRADIIFAGEAGIAHEIRPSSPSTPLPSERLTQSELFGNAPGAFTEAQRGGKPGLLKLANQGTVFLDEIGEISPCLSESKPRVLPNSPPRKKLQQNPHSCLSQSTVHLKR